MTVPAKTMATASPAPNSVVMSLRHVFSEQFHVCLQVGVGKPVIAFISWRKKLSELPAFPRIGNGRGLCPLIRCARESIGEQSILFNDQVEHVADGANALAGLRVVLACHHAREAGEFLGKRSGIFSEMRSEFLHC
jgi:hypothetical protein